MSDDEPTTYLGELIESRDVTCGALSVFVDFNDLLRDYAEEDVFMMLGKLKDLLA